MKRWTRWTCTSLVCGGAVVALSSARGAESPGDDSAGAPAASLEGIRYHHNALIYNGLVGEMPVSVMISSRPFDPAAHHIAKVEGREDDWLLDGNWVRGADGLPKKGFPQLSGLAVRFGDKTVSVPERFL